MSSLPGHALARFLVPIRLYVSPSFGDGTQAPLFWTWRTLLVWLGISWTQVPADAPDCDVAYVAAGDHPPSARLTIKADSQAWGAAQSPSDAPVERMHRFGVETAWEAAVDRSGSAAVCGYDLLPDMFMLLAGVVERAWPRNRHGQVEPKAGHDAGRVWLTPIVTDAVDRFGQLLRSCGVAADVMPRWPGGHSWAACATHDVDYPEVVRWLEPVRMLTRRGNGGLKAAVEIAAGRRDHWQFEQWVSLERAIGVRSAFYFVARRGSLFEYAGGTPDAFYDVTAPAFTQLFQLLDDEGFEVGLHASYRACESREALAREKARLEGAVGHAVDGNRHHYWRLLPSNPDATFVDQAAVGLRYDCSLGFERVPGWRRGSALPFAPYNHHTGEAVDVLQLPTAWMDAQLFMYGSAPVDADDAAHGMLTDLTAAARRSGGLFVADMHEYVYDDVLYPGWRRAWSWLWEEISSRGDAWVARPCDVADHWRRRGAAIVDASRGLAA